MAIGLGVALGAILLGAVALYFFHKRRQNEVKAGNQIGHAAALGEPPLEHGGQDKVMEKSSVRVELDGISLTK